MRALARHKRSVTAIGAWTACALIAAALVLLAPARAEALTPPEQDYLTRINALRASVGVQPLELDTTMTVLADEHTREMVSMHDLHHTHDLKVGVGGNWTKLGENVGYGTTIELTWNAFVNSPSHYANLVDPAFTHVGIVVIQGADGLYWTTHRFLAAGRPTASTATAVATGPTTATQPTVPPTTTAPKPVTPVVAPAPAPAPPPAPVPAPADPARVATVLNALRAA